jgi:hypothetical protein
LSSISTRSSATPTTTGTAALALHFIERRLADPDPLIAAVAATERALALVAQGDGARHEVRWPCDPVPVMTALLARQPIGPAEDGVFSVIVSHGLPELLAVVPQPDAATA